MGGVSIFQILVMTLILALVFFIYLLPIVLAARTNKVKGNEKAVFFFLSLFFGWLGYLPYYLIVVRHK